MFSVFTDQLHSKSKLLALGIAVEGTFRYTDPVTIHIHLTPFGQSESQMPNNQSNLVKPIFHSKVIAQVWYHFS